MEIDSFQYTLVRRSRRRSLTITVSPENQVRVLAPAFLSEGKIRDFLRRKSSWVLKQIEKNTRRPKPALRRYGPDESFSFLGGERTLEIQEAQTGKIELFQNKFIVNVPAKLEGEERRDHIAWRIEDWYRAEAVNVFKGRVAHYQNFVGRRPGAVRVKEFRGQWGSASRRGNLSFNWRLLLAPLEVLDYVVVHELAHLEHPDHSRRFWARVGEILPDYRERRAWLRTHGRFLRLEYNSAVLMGGA